MKKKQGFRLRRLGSEAMIVAESIELIDFDRLVSLNPTAAYIWEMLPDTDFNINTITDLLTDRYEVDETTAGTDADELIKVWIEAGIIEK